MSHLLAADVEGRVMSDRATSPQCARIDRELIALGVFDTSDQLEVVNAMLAESRRAPVTYLGQLTFDEASSLIDRLKIRRQRAKKEHST